MNVGGGPAPRPRAEAQRDRILCAALKCFIEHGFHAASMANIAETAQMSAGLMYRYFDNKNAIVLGHRRAPVGGKSGADRAITHVSRPRRRACCHVRRRCAHETRS